MNVKELAENVCYGREDLMRVAESMANDFGNFYISEELCAAMADAAVELLSKIRTHKKTES